MNTEKIWENLAGSIRIEKDGTTIPVPVEDIRRLIDAREKALGEATVTPTDADEVISEREALTRRAIRAADEADRCHNPTIEAWSDGEQFTSDDLRALAAGFRRSEVPEPSAVEGRMCGPCSRGQHAPCDRENEFWGDCTCSCNAKPQGEPSDAQVLAALNATVRPDQEAPDLSFWGVEKADRMRSALRAAGEVR